MSDNQLFVVFYADELCPCIVCMWSCLDLCEIARIVVNVSECPNDEEHIDRRSMYAQVGRSALWVSWGLITPVVVLVHACRSFVRCSHGPQAATQQGADSIPRVSATHIKGEMKGKHERECCTPCCKHACTCSERGHASVQHYVALCYIVALCSGASRRTHLGPHALCVLLQLVQHCAIVLNLDWFLESA